MKRRDVVLMGRSMMNELFFTIKLAEERLVMTEKAKSAIAAFHELYHDWETRFDEYGNEEE